MEPIFINPDIRQARTLPGSFYYDPDVFSLVVKKVFEPSWQLNGRSAQLRLSGQVLPFQFLEKVLPEPLLFSRDNSGHLHCLSNVCTHRGNLLCEHPGLQDKIRCRYHGRRFALNGKLEFMPEFDQVPDFPSEEDHLKILPSGEWGGFLFCGLEPRFSLEELLKPMQERVGWMPMEDFVHDAGRSRDYLVHANWALYIDNYLEGFHIPFIHPDLAKSLDYGTYRHELFEWCNLQVGVAKGGELSFELPESSPDFGEEIAAYYYWLFPNLMFNFYPWGLSLNIVRPLGPELTRVSFQTYVWKPELLDQGAGALLDKVEREDEDIVEKVQQGVKSQIYRRGRYAPEREQGLHHFHRLLAEVMQ